jgi:hypothetical protein
VDPKTALEKARDRLISAGHPARTDELPMTETERFCWGAFYKLGLKLSGNWFPNVGYRVLLDGKTIGSAQTRGRAWLQALPAVEAAVLECLQSRQVLEDLGIVKKPKPPKPKPPPKEKAPRAPTTRPYSGVLPAYLDVGRFADDEPPSMFDVPDHDVPLDELFLHERRPRRRRKRRV